MAGGANEPSLVQAQLNFAALGASEPRFLSDVRAPQSDEPIDPGWRRLDPRRDRTEEVGPSNNERAADRTAFYYWRTRSGKPD